MQDREYREESRSWALPEEPPVGTVVVGDVGDARWTRDEDLWWEVDGGAQRGYGWGELLQGLGRVTEVVPTPAEEQASRLVNLARHLSEHPGLPAVNLNNELQIKSTDAVEPASLLAWAASMGEPSMRVQFIREVAYVHVSGRVGDRVEEVFDTVPGFFEFLDAGGWAATREAVVPLSTLEEFAGGQQAEGKRTGPSVSDAPMPMPMPMPMPEPGSFVHWIDGSQLRGADVVEIDSAAGQVHIQLTVSGRDLWVSAKELDLDSADGPVE